MTIYVVFVCSEKGQVNNMSTIQDLYYGRISPYEMSISTTPEYQKLKALATKNEDLLKESLSDEQKELLDKLTECITDISSISERDMFIAGFRLGVKLDQSEKYTLPPKKGLNRRFEPFEIWMVSTTNRKFSSYA